MHQGKPGSFRPKSNVFMENKRVGNRQNTADCHRQHIRGSPVFQYPLKKCIKPAKNTIPEKSIPGAYGDKARLLPELAVK